MGLNVYSRYAYDDVAFIASTDADADMWRLEVETGNGGRGWLSVDAVIMDSHMNWSTPDLALWGGLRLGDPVATAEVFPAATRGIPAGTPFAVMWNVSNWYKWTHPRTGQGNRFRFLDPAGRTYEFRFRDVLLLQQRHCFG